MDKNNIITIVAVVLLIGAILFSFDYGTTGRAVSSQDLVVVSPSYINAGDYITIEILPSAKGVNRAMKVMDSADLRKAQINFNHCGSFRCTKSITESYKTGVDWEPGVYYVNYFDYTNMEFKRAFFTIE